MTREEHNGYAIVLPAEGMMLTDGKSVSDKIFAPLDDDLEDIREVTLEEAREIEESQKSERKEETDYENL